MTLLKKTLSLVLLLLLINLLSSYILNYNIIHVISNKINRKDTFIYVDLNDNTLYLIKENEVIKSYPVSGGTPYTPSPLGTWKIVSKADWGEGFGGSWMGFNVPWGKYGIHGTDEPWTIGKSLSKGCIRMYNEDAKELKSLVYVGTKVIITKGAYGPFGDGFRTLAPGAIGSDVYAVQEKLKELGYYNGWVDGKYGTTMEKAVAKFQKDKSLTKTKYIKLEFYKALGIELFE